MSGTALLFLISEIFFDDFVSSQYLASTAGTIEPEKSDSAFQSSNSHAPAASPGIFSSTFVPTYYAMFSASQKANSRAKSGEGVEKRSGSVADLYDAACQMPVLNSQDCSLHDRFSEYFRQLPNETKLAWKNYIDQVGTGVFQNSVMITSLEPSRTSRGR